MPDASESESELSGLFRDTSIDQYKRLIDGNSGWHDVGQLALRAPDAFIKEIWPWLADLFERLACPPHPLLNQYREHHGLAFVAEAGGRRSGMASDRRAGTALLVKPLNSVAAPGARTGVRDRRRRNEPRVPPRANHPRRRRANRQQARGVDRGRAKVIHGAFPPKGARLTGCHRACGLRRGRRHDDESSRSSRWCVCRENTKTGSNVPGCAGFNPAVRAFPPARTASSAGDGPAGSSERRPRSPCDGR